VQGRKGRTGVIKGKKTDKKKNPFTVVVSFPLRGRRGGATREKEADSAAETRGG